ncbi:MAG: response regulator transcription factor [Sedimenticola sp.]
MKRKIRLLIVEDEPAILNGLMDLFVFHGYEVDSADNGDVGLDKALSGHYDLILLDIMLPGVNGYTICERVRQQDRDQPIIMLTAKSADEDVIRGLSLGADDYVAKPFSVAQLVLRVEAVLRRSKPLAAMAEVISIGDDIELDSRNLSGHRGGTTFTFTLREMEIIQYLDANAERPVSREELLTRVWGYAKNLELETRTVDIHIAKIRRKIEPDPAQPQYLTTVRGRGYRLLSS